MGKKGALLEGFFDLWLGDVLDQQISEIGSWHLTSNEDLLLVLRCGRVLFFDCINKTKKVIDEGLEDCLVYKTDFNENKIVVFYQKRDCLVGSCHYDYFSIGAKFIDLETKKSIFFTEIENEFQAVECNFINQPQEEYLIISFIREYYDYVETIHKIINLKTEKIEFEYRFSSFCQSPLNCIMCNSRFLLYLDKKCSLCIYDPISQK